MLWHIKDTNLYFMGSIHVLEQTRHALFPEAERVYQQVDRVTFEHDMVAPPNPVLIENGPGASLSTQVSPGIFANATREWMRLGLDVTRLEQLQPWAAATTIATLDALKRGIDSAFGVDKVLWDRTEQDGKARSTLETQDDALAVFSSMQADEQESFLDYGTNPPTAFQDDIDVMIRAWHEHDERAFTRILDHRLGMWPTGFGNLAAGRNQAWMPTLLRLVSDQVSTLVVIGALHCVGFRGC